MKLETLICNNCGGPLEVPETANAIRCNHCHSQLAVRRESSVTYTEQIQQVMDRTDRLTDQVVQLTYQNELMRIDRDWERERELHLSTSKEGKKSEPSHIAAILVGGVSCTIGLFVCLTGGGFIGMAFLVIGSVIAISQWSQADAYEAARRRYQQRRSNVSPDVIRQGFLTKREQESSNSSPDSFPKLDEGRYSR